MQINYHFFIIINAVLLEALPDQSERSNRLDDLPLPWTFRWGQAGSGRLPFPAGHSLLGQLEEASRTTNAGVKASDLGEHVTVLRRSGVVVFSGHGPSFPRRHWTVWPRPVMRQCEEAS